MNIAEEKVEGIVMVSLNHIALIVSSEESLSFYEKLDFESPKE